MLQAFASLKTLVNVSRRSTETLVFYLHYRVTFLVLIFCCVLISTQQFAGFRIQCLSRPSAEINIELLNSYCWASSTYSVSSNYLEESGVQVPHPGVRSSEKESDYEYRNFYQYVHIILFIQAVLFYIPHLVWKSMERNTMTNLSEVISTCKHDAGSEDQSEKSPMDAVAIYIEDRWGRNKLLVLKYIFCEILSAANVMAQSYLLDIFFHGKFLSLGLLVETYYSSKILSDPIRLFPLVTVCSFRRYGASGYIDVIDALCVLPNNALNAKIFLCLWIWFLILLILSCFSIVHLLMCITVPMYRITLFKIKSLIFRDNCDSDSYRKLATIGDCGDWFILSSIGNNMDQTHFSRLMENLQLRLETFEIECKEHDKENA